MQKKTSKKKASSASIKEPKKWYKTDWDFSPLYSGTNDPKIEKDTQFIEKTYEAFARKYDKDQSYLKSAVSLKKALDEWDKVLCACAGWRPAFYLRHLKTINSLSTEIAAKGGLLTDRLTKAYNKILFFELSLGRIAPSEQKKFLSEKNLSKYKRYLSRIFEKSRYRLSDDAEKIISLKNKTSYQAWVDAQIKLSAQQVIRFQGKNVSIAKAHMMRFELPLKSRHKLHALMVDKLKGISGMAEAELNAIVTDKKTDDDLRGAKQPYEITVVDYDNDVKTVEQLIALTSKNFRIVHDYYKLKAKIMGLKHLTASDLSAPIKTKNKKVEIDEAIEVISEAFNKADPEFKEFFHFMLKNGRIDLYPKKGKRIGGYCSESSENTPIIIMMNYNNTEDALTTLAHEMGHAIHSYLSMKHQPELYAEYTISIAEVASTFFEHIVFDHRLEKMNKKERAYALLDDIEQNIGTIFRQTQFFNFEKDLHAAINAKGAISKEEMAELYMKNAIAANGPAFLPGPNDGYSFVTVPHFRYFFYVYTYAYGQLISRALYAKYKKDPSFIAKIREFLSAGGSRSPYEIFKSIGIDTSDPAFFNEGIDLVRQDLKVATALAKEVGLIKK